MPDKYILFWTGCHFILCVCFDSQTDHIYHLYISPIFLIFVSYKEVDAGYRVTETGCDKRTNQKDTDLTWLKNLMFV